MTTRQQKPPITAGALQDTEEMGKTNNLWNYNTTNTRAMQAAVYPPGWLIARMKQPPPANPISRAQGYYLQNLIRAVTLPIYREYKVKLGISLDTPIHRLTRGQAWQLINAIVTDLEGSRS